MLLPYSDENPTRSFPIINWLLILLNIAVFLVEARLAGQGQLQSQLQQWALIPRDLVQHVGVEQILDLFRSMFLHGGWLHVGSNMLFLYIFGDNIEDALGSLRYLAFYLLCGVAASLAQVALTPNSSTPLIGASGAIAGVLGAYLILFPKAPVRTLFWFIILIRTIRIPAFVLLGGWFVLQFARVYFAANGGMVSDSGVAYAAHVGGFLTGIVLLAVWPPRRQPV